MFHTLYLCRCLCYTKQTPGTYTLQKWQQQEATLVIRRQKKTPPAAECCSFPVKCGESNERTADKTKPIYKLCKIRMSNTRASTTNISRHPHSHHKDMTEEKDALKKWTLDQIELPLFHKPVYKLKK